MKFDLEEVACLWKQCTLLLYDPDGVESKHHIFLCYTAINARFLPPVLSTSFYNVLNPAVHVSVTSG
jgi:hypothetical protein